MEFYVLRYEMTPVTSENILICLKCCITLKTILDREVLSQIAVQIRILLILNYMKK